MLIYQLHQVFIIELKNFPFMGPMEPFLYFNLYLSLIHVIVEEHVSAAVTYIFAMCDYRD